MAWKYDPKNATRCLPKGEYNATMHDCEYKESKKGNDMAEVLIDVYHGDRRVRVRDWIVNHPDMLWKLKHLARAVGKEEQFKAGTFEVHHAVGESVTVGLDVDEDPKYGEQNRIVDYKAAEGGKAAPRARTPVSVTKIPEDSDIPF